MLEQIDQSLKAYNQKWQKLMAGRKDQEFFKILKPVAVGWKVEDRQEYDQVCAELHDASDQIIDTWMNGRWVAKFHLREQTVGQGITIVKIMQRRPQSTDAVGLDHVDFYCRQELAQIQTKLEAETDIEWTRESNDIIEGYDWLSIWFDGTEAKLKSDTVLDIIGVELAELNQKIKQ